MSSITCEVNTNQFQTAATEALERQLEAASAETYAKTHETELMVTSTVIICKK